MVDVLTDLGGMFSSLSLIGLAFNMTFSYNLLLSSLIRKLYHFRPRFEQEIKKKKKKSKDKNAPKTFDDESDDEGPASKSKRKKKGKPQPQLKSDLQTVICSTKAHG